MKLVTRKAWRARSRTLPTNITPQHGGVTMHYVGASRINDSHSSCAGRVRGIQNHHIDGNGWTDIAYSLLICQHGYVYIGRGVHRRTAANGTNSGNQNWYAICFLIGGSQAPSEAAIQAGRDAVAYLRAQGNAGRGINGHRDHLSTSCPGSPTYSLVQAGVFEPGSGSSGTTPANRPVLRLGSSGPAVRELQELLRDAGHSPGTIDGLFGSGTETAVRAFQSANGLTVDGVVGSATWSALLPTDWFDMSKLRSFKATTNQIISLRDWTTVHLGDDNYSLAFESEDYLATVNLVFTFDAPEGVQVTGREVQIRFVEVKPNPDANKPGQPNWVRSKSLVIDSPVQDSGKLHATAVWQDKLPKDRRLRVEVNHFIDGATVAIERVDAKIRYTK